MLGLAFGLSLNAYTTSLFGPRLIAEFGWKRSDFALLGSIALMLLFVFPIVGRLTDRFGVRRIALVGAIGTPIGFLAMSAMNGDIRVFFAITALQILLGAFTTSPVYTRPVAERFVSARGLAFSIVMTGPPLAGALVSPVLADVMEAHGWRAGYQALALLSAVCGLGAIALLPRGAPAQTGIPADAGRARPKPSRADYRRIAQNPAFWVLFVGMFLVNLPQTLATSQLAVMLAENGATPAIAARMISAYALGVIIGRFCSGLALDRLPPKAVAVIGLGLPGLGMLLLASPVDATAALALAILFMGLAQGAEGDVAAFLAARHFDLSVYSLVTGLVSAGTAAAASFGAILLSLFLRRWDAFAPFLLFGAAATFLGAGMFLLLHRGRRPA